MKDLKYFLLSPACMMFFLCTSCVTVHDKIYIQEAEVFGPIMNSPVHLTDSAATPSFTLSPRFSYSTTNKFYGEIEQHSEYASNDSIYKPSENSLIFNVAEVNAGIDMDWALSRTIALTLGVSYSSQSNFSSLGGNFGIGFNTYNTGIAFRFDIGMQFYSMKYDAYTVLEKTVHNLFGNDEHYTIYYHDIGESAHFDPYFNLTFNTAYRGWPVNIFINAGYVVQTLLSFEPRHTHREYWGNEHITTDARGTSTMGFINLTPGIFFYIGESNRLLLGSKFYIETKIRKANPKYFTLPFVQMDFRL